MNFENEYLIKLNKYVRDKCSGVCGFDKIEEKFLLNNDKHIDKNEIFLFKDNFVCFEKCNAKYFESGVLSLESFANYFKDIK
jgi:hypothetical protein